MNASVQSSAINAMVIHNNIGALGFATKLSSVYCTKIGRNGDKSASVIVVVSAKPTVLRCGKKKKKIRFRICQSTAFPVIFWTTSDNFDEENPTNVVFYPVFSNIFISTYGVIFLFFGIWALIVTI